MGVLDEIIKKTQDVNTQRESVRKALQLSAVQYSTLATQNQQELDQMVSQNRARVGAALGKVSAVLDEATTAHVKVSADEVKMARIEAIKGATVGGLKQKSNVGRDSREQNKLYAELSEQLGEMTSEEISAVYAAHELGDIKGLKSIYSSIRERIAAKNKGEQGLGESHKESFAESPTFATDNFLTRYREKIVGVLASSGVIMTIPIPILLSFFNKRITLPSIGIDEIFLPKPGDVFLTGVATYLATALIAIVLENMSAKKQ